MSTTLDNAYPVSGIITSGAAARATDLPKVTGGKSKKMRARKSKSKKRATKSRSRKTARK